MPCAAFDVKDIRNGRMSELLFSRWLFHWKEEYGGAEWKEKEAKGKRRRWRKRGIAEEEEDEYDPRIEEIRKNMLAR